MTQSRSQMQEGAVLIADDHAVFRYGLGQVLRGQFGVATILEADSFEQALTLLHDRSIFLALLDLDMPGLKRSRDLEQVRRLRPDVRLVVLTGSERREDILAALAAGVHGYLVKSARTETLVALIARVLAGEICVPPSLAELPSVSALEAEVNGARAPPLTDRQSAVLRLLAQGLPNKSIARALGISEGTVKLHVASILRTTGAKNRAQASAIAKQWLT